MNYVNFSETQLKREFASIVSECVDIQRNLKNFRGAERVNKCLTLGKLYEDKAAVERELNYRAEMYAANND
jgi:hypothetical protein|tara:strand:- start:800 stop:1012 length:213 start_codon:yes stop_codon:yes gene_type:complete